MSVHAARPLVSVARNTLLYSVIIPAYNEAENVASVVERFAARLRTEQIPFELVVVNDNSTDATAAVVEAMTTDYPEIRLVHNGPPGGLGRAIRRGSQANPAQASLRTPGEIIWGALVAARIPGSTNSLES